MYITPLRRKKSSRQSSSCRRRAQAPVTEGTIAGKLSFYLGETCVGETYLLYDTDVRRDAVVGSSLLRRVLDFLNRADSAAFLTAFAPHTS